MAMLASGPERDEYVRLSREGHTATANPY